MADKLDQKKCSKCGKTKPISHFNASSRNPDGIALHCRACVNAGRRAATKRRENKSKDSSVSRLIAATKKGDLSSVQRLLPKNAVVRLDGLLSLASQSHGPRKQSKLLDVCEFLLSSGANPNAFCDYGPMICLATTTGVGAYVEILNQHGAKTDIYSAAALGDVEGVRNRLRRNPSLAMTTDRIEKTPLHYCAGSALWRDGSTTKERLVDVGNLLLDTGAKVDADCLDPRYTTPFSLAATLSQPESETKMNGSNWEKCDAHCERHRFNRH